MNTELPMFVIYWNPQDFPDNFVVRRWLVAASGPIPDDGPTAVVQTLDEARRSIPEGLVRLERHHADQKQIVEIWV